MGVAAVQTPSIAEGACSLSLAPLRQKLVKDWSKSGQSLGKSWEEKLVEIRENRRSRKFGDICVVEFGVDKISDDRWGSGGFRPHHPAALCPGIPRGSTPLRKHFCGWR